MSLSSEIEKRVSRGSNDDTIYTLCDKEGLPIDLTSAVVELCVKLDPNVATPIIALSSATTGIVIDPDQVTNTGQFTVSFVPADTAGLTTFGEYYYSIWVTLSSGKIYPILPRSRFFVDNDLCY